MNQFISLISYKMSWFCHTTAKKRSNKRRVGGIGRKSSRKEIERHPTFVVVVKSCTASLRDELSVHRGQVVEVVCTKGNLIYVRDMNSNVGYIPKDHTLDIESMESTFINGGNNDNVIRLSNGNITGLAAHTRSIDASTLQRSGSSVNSVEVHQVSNGTDDQPVEAGEGQTTPTLPSSCSSPQVIYDIPRYPDGTPVVISEGVAPSLPPRTSLPILTEVQNSGTCSVNHASCRRQRYHPGDLNLTSPVSNKTQCTCLPPRPKYQNGSIAPTSDTSPCKCHTTTCGPNSPLTFSRPRSTSCAMGHPTYSPGFSPPAWTPGANQRTEDGISPRDNRKPRSQTFSSNIPNSNEVSADGPTSHASQTIRHNSSEDMMNQKIRRKFVNPSSSIPSSFGQRMKGQRNRRYSANIAGNISFENASDYREDVLALSKHSRRQSQPCVFKDQLASTPPVGSTSGNRCLPQRQSLRLRARRSLSMCEPEFEVPPTGHSSLPCTPVQKQHDQHRVPSCQHSVLTEDRSVAADITNNSEVVSHPIASLPSRQFRSGYVVHRMQRSKSGSNQIDSVKTIEASKNALGVSVCASDDIFFSNVKKPHGIYKCLKTYKPKFRGEISLYENEMVIVLDYGRGEWAWVVTSANLEGLVPKSILVKYRSSRNGNIGNRHSYGSKSECPINIESRTASKQNGTESAICVEDGSLGIDVATQTDIPYIPFRSSSRCVSVGYSSYSSSSGVPTNESSPLSTSLRADTRKGKDRKDAQDGIVLLEAAATAIGEHVVEQTKAHPHKTKEWFNTIDSLDERERIFQHTGNESSDHMDLNSTQVHSSSTQMEARATPESSLSSMDTTDAGTIISPLPGGTSPPAVTPLPETTETTATELKTEMAAAGGTSVNEDVIKRGGTRRHDRLMSLGSVSFNNKIVSSLTSLPRPNRRSRQLGLSNVLTAVKNYSPPSTAKNCLPIKEGDILHLQTHMHYPKGWMWVWHTKKRSFGYVPKSYVEYTYDTTKKNQSTTQEDEV